jgi:hypothetical protein
VVNFIASDFQAGTGGVAAGQLVADWADATAKAEQLASAGGLTLNSFARISAYDFYGDFHRTVYAGELALRDMGQERVNQYKVLMGAFPATPAPIAMSGSTLSDQNAVHVAFQNQFKQVFGIFRGLGSAKPSGHFTIDLKGKKVSNAESAALSFN